MSVLNFPCSISKRIFSRTAPLKTNVTYYRPLEREACLWRIYVSTLPKRFQTTKISAKCSSSGFSGVEFRLRSPEVERKYSELGWGALIGFWNLLRCGIYTTYSYCIWYVWIFCELRSIFFRAPPPPGERNNTSNEQNVRSY